MGVAVKYMLADIDLSFKIQRKINSKCSSYLTEQGEPEKFTLCFYCRDQSAVLTVCLQDMSAQKCYDIFAVILLIQQTSATRGLIYADNYKRMDRMIQRELFKGELIMNC